jgi:hypothetical protein
MTTYEEKTWYLATFHHTPEIGEVTATQLSPQFLETTHSYGTHSSKTYTRRHKITSNFAGYFGTKLEAIDQIIQWLKDKDKNILAYIQRNKLEQTRISGYLQSYKLEKEQLT